MAAALVIIPTYNERENIAAMVQRVLAQPEGLHLLVVDDSSPDGTAAIVQSLQPQAQGRLHLLQRPGKQGLGMAYVAGFRWGLDRGYEYLFEMDADFSHNPDDLPALLHACRDEGFDLAVGSRYVTGVNVVNWPIGRVLLSYFASVYVRWITGMQIRDATAGFKCYRAEVLRTVLAEPLRFVGYAFQIEMKFKAWKYGFRIREVPIIFTERVNGHSKMTRGIVREAVWGVLVMKVTSWFRSWQRPALAVPQVAAAGTALSGTREAEVQRIGG